MFNIKYTYHNDDFSCFSSPDHILTTSYLIDNVSIHDTAENFSNHLSLHFAFKFTGTLSVYALHVHLAILLDTSHSLSTGIKLLQMMSLFTVITSFPLYLNFLLIFNCCDTDCTARQSMLNSYCEQLFNSVPTAADLCLPKYRVNGHTSCSLSGWNSGTRPLKQSANFWHKVWSECGCPSSGVLFQIKRPARESLSMNFVVYAIISATSDEKTLLMHSFTLLHRNSRNKLRRSSSLPKVFVYPLFPTPLMVVVIMVRLLTCSHPNMNPF